MSTTSTSSPPPPQGWGSWLYGMGSSAYDWTGTQASNLVTWGADRVATPILRGGARAATRVAQEQLLPYQPQFQEARQLRDRVFSTPSPHVAEARMRLDALLNLAETSDAQQRQVAIWEANVALGRLQRDAPQQLTDNDNDQIMDLVIALGTLDVNTATLNQIKDSTRAVHARVVQIFNETSGPYVQLQAQMQQFQNTLEVVRGTVNTVQTTVQGLVNPPAQSPVNPTNPAAGLVANPLNQTVSAAVGIAQDMFNRLTTNMESALARQAARNIASLLHAIFSFLLQSLRSNNDAQRQAAIAHIRPSVDRMQSASQAGSWQELQGALTDFFTAFQRYEIYFQDIHLPRTVRATSPISEMLERARALVEPPLKPTNVASPALVSQKIYRFQERTIFRLALLAVNRAFKFNWNESVEYELLKWEENVPPSSHSKVYNSRIQAQINKSTASPMTKWAAKTLYTLVHSWSGVFIRSAMKTIHHDFTQWQKKDSHSKEKDILKLLRNYFSVMSGIYTSVAQSRPEKRNKDIYSMLIEESQSPSRNANMPPEKSYCTLLMTVLQFAKVNWTQNVADYFDTRTIPSKRTFTFISPLLDGMRFFSTKTAQFLVIIPQSFFNLMIQAGGWILSKALKPQTLIAKHITPMEDVHNAMTFAIQEGIVYAQLRVIINLLRTRLNETSGEVNYVPPDLQLECASLVKSMLGVLNKSQKLTVDDLQKFENGDLTLAERMQRELENFILPHVNEPLSNIICTALESALDEKSLMEIECDLLTLADKLHDPKKTVTRAQVHAVDEGISSLIDELIHVLTGYVIDENLDVGNIKKQQKITECTQALRRRTQEFKDKMTREQAIVANSSTPLTHSAAAVREMTDVCYKFYVEEVEAAGKASGNRFLQGIHNQLDDKRTQLTSQTTAIWLKILDMGKLQKEIDAQQLAVESYGQARSALDAFEFTIRHTDLSEPHLQNAASNADALASHIAKLRACAPEDAQPLIPLHDQLKIQHTRVTHSIKHLGILNAADRAFTEFTTLKQQTVTQNTPSILGAYRRLNELLQQLPQRQSLTESLNRCLVCHTAHDLQGTFSQFMQASTQTHAVIELDMQTARGEVARIRDQMIFYLSYEGWTRNQIAIKRQSLLEKNAALQPDLNAFGVWAGAIEDTTILSIQLFPFMPWLRNTLHALAIWQAKGYVKACETAFIKAPFPQVAVNEGVKLVLKQYGPRKVRESIT